MAEEPTMAEIQSFDLVALETALTELGRRCYEAGRTIEIAVYGGSALLLTLNREVNTADVDAVFEGTRTSLESSPRGWRRNSAGKRIGSTMA
jgi:hypothetical protein